MEYIYVLKCNSDDIYKNNFKYYVGKTRDVEKRFKEHLGKSTFEGSVWTTKYKLIEIIETSESNTNTTEFNKTLEYMKRYGIDNVRGGPFCQLDISHHKESIKAIISSIEDRCYVCKKRGILRNNVRCLQSVKKAL